MGTFYAVVIFLELCYEISKYKQLRITTISLLKNLQIKRSSTVDIGGRKQGIR